MEEKAVEDGKWRRRRKEKGVIGCKGEEGMNRRQRKLGKESRCVGGRWLRREIASRDMKRCKQQQQQQYKKNNNNIMVCQ